LCAIASATAGADTASAAPPTPAPYGTNDAGSSFRDVLPPGTNGLANGTDIISFLTAGKRPPHNDDQLAMYRDLLWGAPGLKPADLPRFYKDSTFDEDQWANAPYTEADLQKQVDNYNIYGAEGRLLRTDGENYVAGFNQYMDEAKLNPLLMPGEYAALGKPEPEPFKLTDVIAIA